MNANVYCPSLSCQASVINCSALCPITLLLACLATLLLLLYTGTSIATYKDDIRPTVQLSSYSLVTADLFISSPITEFGLRLTAARDFTRAFLLKHLIVVVLESVQKTSVHVYLSVRVRYERITTHIYKTSTELIYP